MGSLATDLSDGVRLIQVSLARLIFVALFPTQLFS